ncbi:carbohydrate ABC transporter permease [Paenibacillus sp. CF384]|uniref:carbohydrate ABC transporter permease n=1 Tax=Paenibacillus sp. CF384 TaxID=1884382 RepID=UPI00089A0FF7|nr:sugar ABC transporter permease [Paenibacillus sp. CF384]SDX06825.1 multiple sugar transport system permease protein [Paenibacillus sp. CF384]
MQSSVEVNNPLQLKSQKVSRFKLSQAGRKAALGYLFLSPFLILFIVFTVVPVVQSVYLSFTYYNMLQPAKWVGLSNYSVLFLEDDIFIKSLKNTFIFAVIAGPLSYCLSFLLAWIINTLRAKMLFSLAFYVPSITSGIALSIVWLYIFSGDRYGLLNNWMLSWGMISEPILWTTDPDTIMPVIIIVSLWMSMGTGFLVFLAGLQNVSPELYEAGSIDGISSRFQELWFITLPLMKPQLLFGAVNSIVAAFGVFDIAVAIAGMPSPNYAGHTIISHLFDYAFIRFELGYASSIAVFLFFLTFGLGRIVMKLLSSKEQ